MARRPATNRTAAAQQLVGDKIREARLAAGMTQEVLAERADLHPVFVSRLEGGRANPSLGTLTSVADALDTSVSELVAGV